MANVIRQGKTSNRIESQSGKDGLGAAGSRAFEPVVNRRLGQT